MRGIVYTLSVRRNLHPQSLRYDPDLDRQVTARVAIDLDGSRRVGLDANGSRTHISRGRVLDMPPEHGAVYSRHFKEHWDDDRYYLCPAPVSAELEAQLLAAAKAAYRALGCRDVGRVDLRLDAEGQVHVLELNPLPGMAPGFSDLPRAAAAGGWSYVELVNGILDVCLYRLGLAHLASDLLIPRKMLA